MKTKFILAATVLMILAAPVSASTPIADPFTRLPDDQAAPPVPDQNMGNTYGAPFRDHLKQNRMGDMRPTDSRGRNNLTPPRGDASGVPDPRI